MRFFYPSGVLDAANLCGRIGEFGSKENEVNENEYRKAQRDYSIMSEAAFGLIGVCAGAVIGIAETLYTTYATLKEGQRNALINYLSLRMQWLSENLADYETYLASYEGYIDGDRVAHAGIIGKAIANCLSVADAPLNTDIINKSIRWNKNFQMLLTYLTMSSINSVVSPISLILGLHVTSL